MLSVEAAFIIYHHLCEKLQGFDDYKYKKGNKISGSKTVGKTVWICNIDCHINLINTDITDAYH